MSRASKTRLHDEIVRLIDADFSSMSFTEIAQALEDVSVEYERRAREAASKIEEAPKSSAAQASSVGRVSSLSSEADSSVIPEIAVVAEDEYQVASLLHQIVDIGALMMQVDEPLQLNEFVTLVLEYEPAQFAMQVTGRVVNISPRGTAIEIMKLERDDHVALEQLYRDYQHLIGVNPDASAAPAKPPRVPPATAEELRAPSTTQHGHARPKTQPRVSITRSSEGLKPYQRVGSTLNEPRLTVRRQVNVTAPDEEVVASSSKAAARPPEEAPAGKVDEFYGPMLRWLEPPGDADRIEELASDRIVDILLQLSGRSFSGMLELEHPTDDAHPEEVRWQLFFDAGFLVEAVRTPRLARVELGHMLLLAHRADKTQLSMAAAHAEEAEISLARAMLELDLLSPDTLRHAIAGRLTFLLRLLCNTEAGTVRIYESRSLPAGFLPMPPLRVHVPIERTVFQLLFERLRQLSPRERERQAGEELDAYPEASMAEEERLERALVDDVQRRMVERLANGRKRLREVFTESALSGADTFAVLFALHRMGLLQFDRSLHHTVVRERYRENVTVKYLSVHKASYFEVLNVHWSSYDEVVEQAYRELIQQFDPAGVPENLEREVHQRVREIRERVESAYQVLARREHRHAYRTRIMPEYKLAHAIPLFLKQSELAERRQEWEESCDSLRRVLEIAPDHDGARKRLERARKFLEQGSLQDDDSSAPL